jgi:glyoxylase-like metal-dependent hydrolase (beta-lactamase superfamily II)
VKGAELPIVATEGVDRIIRRDDDLKEQILRPMFGDEWPARRTFPNQTVRDGDSVRFDGVELTVVDLGPGESPHDSMWLLGGDPRHAFTGDQAYNHMHGYFADGFHEAWRANIDRLLRELPGDATLYLGHGEPAAPALLTWQRGYIEAFLEAVDGAEWSDPERAKQQAIKQVKAYLPGDRLQFLMELSVEPTAAQMGLLAEPAA